MKTIFLFTLFYSILAAQDPIESARQIALKIDKPEGIDVFNPLPHLAPFNQDTTNSCWSFSTLSFLESEMQRTGVEPVRLAVIFPVYWGFVEKTKYYLQKKGNANFTENDLFSGVFDVILKYGIVPQSVYRGQMAEAKTYNHDQLYDELKSFIYQTIPTENLWNRQNEVIDSVKAILDRHLGAPPEKFIFNDKEYTPISFFNDYVKIDLTAYKTYTSFTYDDYNQFIELKVPDNWAQHKTYYNVPLEQFYKTLIAALKNGYSAAIDADTGEPGRIGDMDICFIPDFDLPSKLIDQKAREFRFWNKSTTDDHLMHIIGYKNHKGVDWFLVKDSWRSAWFGEHKGYYFMRGDYVKLKVLAFIIHKDAIDSKTESIMFHPEH